MIYELRTYTVKPGTLGDIVKAASTVSRDIRGDDYGKLEGYWLTEIGPLNQVLHMWSYNSFDERAKLRGELAKNPRWTGEYVPLIRPLLVRQDVRLMQRGAGRRWRRHRRAMSTNSATIAPRRRAAVKQWLDAFTAVLPEREKYSKIVGLWQTEAGQPNEVCHIWAYPEPERPRRSPRQRDEGSGLAGISGEGPGFPRGDALDHHAAGAALAVEVGRS